MASVMILSLFINLSPADQAVRMMMEAPQLQEIANNTEQQLTELKKVLSQAKNNAAAMEQAKNILEKMNAGIGQSLEAYKGTAAYERALLDLQKEGRMKDAALVRSGQSSNPAKAKEHFESLEEFQMKAFEANDNDLRRQESLQEVLAKAEPGFVSKVGAQVELDHWRTSTRVSAQMTELIAAIHAMREELRILREAQGGGASVIERGLVEARQKENSVR